MFTKYTYQDWLATSDKVALIPVIVDDYKGSVDFQTAKKAQKYYESDNITIESKKILEADTIKVKDENGRERVQYTNKQIDGNKIRSNFFNRLVNQEASYLVGNGVTIGGEDDKSKLGYGFDTVFARIAIKSLIHGVCWGFWNKDHLECLPAYVDMFSGSVALLDEETSVPRVLIRFWRIAEDKPNYYMVFEEDGITTYRSEKSGMLMVREKTPYVVTVASDAGGKRIVGTTNYTRLPVFPLYANEEKRSELTLSIVTKIDLYDRILSDFGDNLDRSNDVYWVLNNFGGNSDEVLQMMKQIREIKAVCNISDGVSAGSTAEPHTFEVPYEARNTALDLLKKAIFDDYMALDMASLTGGYLTNIAIKAAMTGMDLKADAFEWQCFEFVQNILKMNGVNTEEIRFKRRTLVNDAEIISSIYQMREDIDLRTALRLNPMINQDDIDRIIKAKEEENVVMGNENEDDPSESSEDGEKKSEKDDASRYFDTKEYRMERGVIYR